jgi:beta-glucosidase
MSDHRSFRALVCTATFALVTAASAATPTPAAPATTVHPELWPKTKAPPLVDAATESRITALIAQMSVPEKVGQLIQADISAIKPDDLREYPLGSILAGGDSGPYDDERASPQTWLKLAREFHAVAMEARPGHVQVPVIFGVDGVHGHNNVVGASVFPHNIALGATRDADLVRRIAVATAEEIATTGIDWTFAPAVTVPTDVRWGRTYEGFSSEPDVVARLAAAAVEGLQGAPTLTGRLQAGRVAATAKHFLADGGTTFGEDQGDAHIPESALIARHSPGYVAAINAGVLTVMASYSSWNGTKMHGNGSLMNQVLKGRMGFQGVIVGDYNGHEQVPGCYKDRCAAAINAGIDLIMVPLDWKAFFKHTIESVKSGELPMARLDDAVRRNLRVKFALGMFDSARPFEGRFENFASEAHHALAREAVRKSLVLLKNDGVLPIRSTARVLLSDMSSLAMQTGGWTITWQGSDTRSKDFPKAETISQGLRAAIRAGGGTVTDTVNDPAGKPDVAIVVFGEQPYAEMFGDIKLPFYNQRTGLRAINYIRSMGIPVVTVFLSGRPLWVNQEINASQAFVAGWQPGTEGGGVADLLIGDAKGAPRHDFSGTLSYPWPSSAVLAPFARQGDQLAPAFPVGYGLSYAHGGKVGPLSEDLGGR